MEATLCHFYFYIYCVNVIFNILSYIPKKFLQPTKCREDELSDL